MRGPDIQQDALFNKVSPESRVPKYHPLRPSAPWSIRHSKRSTANSRRINIQHRVVYQVLEKERE